VPGRNHGLFRPDVCPGRTAAADWHGAAGAGIQRADFQCTGAEAAAVLERRAAAGHVSGVDADGPAGAEYHDSELLRSAGIRADGLSPHVAVHAAHADSAGKRDCRTGSSGRSETTEVKASGGNGLSRHCTGACCAATSVQTTLLEFLAAAAGTGIVAAGTGFCKHHGCAGARHLTIEKMLAQRMHIRFDQRRLLLPL